MKRVSLSCTLSPGAGQKISPDGKAKIQLQLVLHTGESTTFHFSNESSALRDREAAKELLQQLLPKFKKKANKELEEKNRSGYIDTPAPARAPLGSSFSFF